MAKSYNTKHVIALESNSVDDYNHNDYGFRLKVYDLPVEPKLINEYQEFGHGHELLWLECSIIANHAEIIDRDQFNVSYLYHYVSDHNRGFEFNADTVEDADTALAIVKFMCIELDLDPSCVSDPVLDNTYCDYWRVNVNEEIWNVPDTDLKTQLTIILFLAKLGIIITDSGTSYDLSVDVT